MTGSFDLHWRKSSFSADNGNCVEVAVLADGRVVMRDSKVPAAGTLAFSRTELGDWLLGVRAGEFDPSA